MFSNAPRCIYDRNQLAEVVCQFRFPELLTIEANLPVEFQEAIRGVFPQYSSRKEIPAPQFTGTPGQITLQKQNPVTNHQFLSADGIWRVNLTSKFISLSCTRYTCWEDFASMLDLPLVTFIKLYKPAWFERVGLRYVNFVSRQELELVGTPFSQLFQPCYVGILSEEDISENSVIRSSLDTEVNIRGGCKVKLHAGPGLVRKGGKPDGEVKFVFDQDLYMPGKVPVSASVGALQTLHAQADAIFRFAITDTLHDAMEPRNL